MLEKLKNKINIDNLPIYLLVIVVINLLPLAIPNALTKKSCGASTIFIISAFAVQCILMFLIFYKELKVTKKGKLNLLLLSIISLVQFTIRILEIVVFKENMFMDILDIACKFATIFSFYILMLDVKVKEEKIFILVKGIVYIILVACLFNMIFYSRELFNSFFKGEFRKNFQVFKGFFANRNQFSFFIYIGIAMDMLLILKDKDIKYKIFLGIFIFNVVIALSRTAMLIVFLFMFMFLVSTDKIKLSDKIEIAMLIMIAGMIIFIGFSKIAPNICSKILIELKETYIRPASLKTLSGRTNLWSLAITLASTSLLTMLLGYGRFNGIKAIKARGDRFTQFHNTFIEALVSGGIIEVLYIVFIYGNVFKTIIKSNLENKYKRLYISFEISSMLYMFSESIGRFSIGIVDLICIITFVTLPILHSNCKKVE